MPTAKKTKTASAPAKKKSAKTTASKTTASKTTAPKKKASAPAPVTLDWSTAIKKAAEQKRNQANWPGTGEAWKKKTRM